MSILDMITKHNAAQKKAPMNPISKKPAAKPKPKAKPQPKPPVIRPVGPDFEIPMPHPDAPFWEGMRFNHGPTIGAKRWPKTNMPNVPGGTKGAYEKAMRQRSMDNLQQKLAQRANRPRSNIQDLILQSQEGPGAWSHNYENTILPHRNVPILPRIPMQHARPYDEFLHGGDTALRPAQDMPTPEMMTLNEWIRPGIRI